MSLVSARRVLVTRAAEDARLLAQGLELAGFTPVTVPLLVRTWDVAAVAAAVADVPWDLIALTSPTAVEVLATAAPRVGLVTKLAVVGPATARRAAQLGYQPTVAPPVATAKAMLDAIATSGITLRGSRVLVPNADLADPLLADGLEALGAEVRVVIAYRNESPPGHAEAVHAALPVDATTLLSSSAAHRLAAAIAPNQLANLGKIVAIGPSTARTCAQVGLPVHVIAEPHTAGGVIEAISRLFTA